MIRLRLSRLVVLTPYGERRAAVTVGLCNEYCAKNACPVLPY